VVVQKSTRGEQQKVNSRCWDMVGRAEVLAKDKDALSRFMENIM